MFFVSALSASRHRPTYMRATVLLLLLAGVTGGCSGQGTIGRGTAEAVKPLIEEMALLELVAELAPICRLPATPGFNRALEIVHRRLQQGGFTSLPVPPPDGDPQDGAPPAYCFYLSDSLAYEVWQPISARLEVLGPAGFVVADTRHTPVVLAQNSKATPPGGVTARLYNLGNGTYPQEYEGIDVHGAVVYGRQPAMDIYRAAVVERGALGVVSPSAPPWQGTDDYPALVAYGQVGSDGFGFKISPQMAVDLEDAIQQGSGSVRVRATVNTARLEGQRLRTLVAEIPGREISLERVALIAPLSGPAPGATDVSGAAALAEAAVALYGAIERGDLKRPRRGIVFVWGAALSGSRSWSEHYPKVVEGLHSATVIQFVGWRQKGGEPTLLIERMPDPSAVWTRPPDHHTAWGAARPPHWPFEGHYISELTEEIAPGAARGSSSWRVGSNPYEGAADHEFLLELLIPAQRMWNFPDPLYRCNLDGPEHIDTHLLVASTVAAAVTAYETALGDLRTARRILRLIEDRARRRMSIALDQAGLNLGVGDSLAATTGDRRLEEEILNAWKIWYLEALESVMAHPPATEVWQLRNAVLMAVNRLGVEWNEGMLALGLAPLPLPERFYMGLREP